ncbi:hypothetical protein GLOTRDRAFT_120322 [Gloeophyllum trabeum ATCC 11539]|uniref:Glycoside hydrolase family 32 protein n=1 Tax=Gloeophyllum trabeum (strain ATCC 11539 / FP-39264 / Madison 617) TaxID=670483 RepID=S7RQK6_GLOTA|nr:uncharacterized protein GLOTRDRAFT_120322 [Gloeophyllum trabeum ATCC 11539]EPQ56865.1 hypothetical protein GLOTRDRAFT_120322 [Gloeophyllum trabeum ATCC 11539]
MWPLTLPLAIGLAALAQASVFAADAEPIPGNYSGQLRPQIHFSPPKEFMNDPNGMFLDAEGTYHLYYQYNPTNLVGGNQTWGHATSKDLFHWINQPIAIHPPNNNSQVYSGSAVIDVNNTSGFFPNQTNGVVAIYTLNSPNLEVQEIAYSLDGGYTFERYEGNPVLDVHSSQFRDPKVLWHAETGKWVMVVAYATDLVIGIYTSPNLKDWTHASNFSRANALGSQYECPNLVALPLINVDGSSSTAYILQISINPGAPLGGSITTYFPGSFNGTHFTPSDSEIRFTDFAKDNYAGQFFYGLPADEKQLSIIWANNWQYAESVPTDEEGWRSAMSLAKANSLRDTGDAGYQLVQELVDLRPVYNSTLANVSTSDNLSTSVDYSSVTSGAVYLDVNITNIVTPAGSLNLTFTSTSGGSLSAGYLLSSGEFWINRGNIHEFANFSNDGFTETFNTTYCVEGSVWRLQAVVDRTLLEVFIDRGKSTATMVFYPADKLDGLTVSAEGLGQDVGVSATVWGLKSAWAEEADASGIVLGNVTSTT